MPSRRLRRLRLLTAMIRAWCPNLRNRPTLAKPHTPPRLLTPTPPAFATLCCPYLGGCRRALAGAHSRELHNWRAATRFVTVETGFRANHLPIRDTVGVRHCGFSARFLWAQSGARTVRCARCTIGLQKWTFTMDSAIGPRPSRSSNSNSTAALHPATLRMPAYLLTWGSLRRGYSAGGLINYNYRSRTS